MNSFSFNRFFKMFRWVLRVDFRSQMMWTVGFCIAVFLGELLFFAFSKNGSLTHTVNNLVQFCTIFIMIALAVCVSTLFSDINKTPKREAFLMVPASNLEKFLSVVFYVTVVGAICIFLSVVVGDTMRMVFRGLVYGDEWVSAIPMIANALIPNTMFFNDATHVYSLSYRVMNVLVGYSFLLWIHSFYTLGGTLLRKYAFVVTSVAMIVFMMVLSWVINHIDVSLFTSQWNGHAYVGDEVGVLAYVLAIMMPLLSIFNYWASFQIFKGIQLITHKWTNYDIFK